VTRKPRVAFDTSVIVAGLVASHPHHARAFVWLSAAQQRTIIPHICSHALAEAWATLTAAPLAPRIAGAQASALLDRATARWLIVDGSRALAMRAMERCVERGVASGAIYDAIHVVAAEEARVSALLTFDVRGFERLASSPGPKILAPPDPPSLEVG
jgi:predicted nucleic acid-binding protein